LYNKIKIGGVILKKNGFVTSALLYGILSLFLVLILGTVTTLANRKLATDKIKESAIDDVQHLTTPTSCFTVEEITDANGNGTGIITGYNTSCDKTVFIPESINGLAITTIGAHAFLNQKLVSITIKSNITEIKGGSGINTSESNPTDPDDPAFSGNDGIIFYIKKSNSSIEGAPWGAKNATVHWN
jgi:hypothetical protein